MNPKDTRIVFMGTPPFAVASLDALVKAGFSIVSVVTAPDKPAGRGLQLQQSAVKKYAVENNLPVLQPTKLKDPAFIEALKVLDAQLFVVVAFRMLPEVVWDMPPMGTINVHGSLLPSYRGAAPINWAVINGEKETGATTFRLKHEIDTGGILMQREIPITEYSPKKIKMAITGNGNASKEQVAKMLQSLLKIKELPQNLDATDGLAAAVCHFYNSGNVTVGKNYTGWAAFVKQNGKRVTKYLIMKN